MRLAVIAIAAATILGLAGCDKDAPAATSQGAARSASPNNPTQAAAATPAAATTPPSTGKATSYDCKALLSDAEAHAATGLDLKLADPKNGAADPFAGFTDCGYFASDGTYLQASVWTGQAYQQGFLPLVQAARAGGAEAVSGVGDEAGWSPQTTTLGVRVGSTGITIAYELTAAEGPADPKGSAVKLATIVISHL